MMLPTRPKISVVMPCRNNAAYAGEAVESILAQTLPVHEIIFVDDASTDDSAEAARRAFSCITVIRGVYGSCAAARNAGLAIATGDALAFLDADDVWPPRSLEARFGAMQSAGADIGFGRVRQTWLEANEDAKPIGPEMVGRLAGSMLVARPVFDLVGVFDDRFQVSEAIDWMARATDAGVTMASCPDLVLYRRVHHTNTMRLTENVHRLPLQALRTIVARRSAPRVA
jgi:glycosyltransferase involved in cell wall biosynthesis